MVDWEIDKLVNNTIRSIILKLTVGGGNGISRDDFVCKVL